MGRPASRIPHDDPDYPHGTYPGWLAGCRCQPCLDIRNAYQKEWRAKRRAANPLPPRWVDAQPLREHIHWLLGHRNVTLDGIAGASGLNLTTLFAIREGRRARRDTARYLLSVTPQRARGAAYHVPRRVPVQQMRSLQANGWPLGTLAEMLGRRGTSWLYEDRRIRHDVAADVDRLYTQIGDRPGGNNRVAAHARRLGWWPPIHYDDDGNLIPESIPTGKETNTGQEAMYRRRFASMKRLLNGESRAQIGEELGFHPDQISRFAQEVGWRATGSGERHDLTVKVLREAIQATDVDLTLDPEAVWKQIPEQVERLVADSDAGAAA